MQETMQERESTEGGRKRKEKIQRYFIGLY